MLTLDQLKRNVFPGESGGDYGALYGYANRPGGPFAGVNLQDMTVNEVLQFTDPSGPYAQWVKGQVGHVATPVGAFQTVGSTLRDAVKNMGLTGNEKFNQPVQDAIGMWIYQNQGPQAWVGWGKGGGNSAPSNNGGQPMGLLSMSTSGMPEQPKPTFWDKLGEIGPMLMMMDPSTRDAGMAFAEMNAVKAGKAEQKAASNRTIEWLRSQAAQYPQLAPLLGAAESGSVDMGTVVNTAFQVIQEASKPKPPVDLTSGAPENYMWKDPTNQALGVVPIPGVSQAAGYRSTTPEEERIYGGPGQIGPDGKYYPLENGQGVDPAAVDNLRKEFTGLPIVKDFSGQSQAFGRIVAAANSPSPAGDLSLIFNYMKLLDPGSVVRETEFQTAQDATAWLQRSEELGITVPAPVAAAIRKLDSGLRLNSAQRKDFVSQAQNLYKAAETGFASVEDQYKGIATARSYPLDQSVVDFRYSGPGYQPPQIASDMARASGQGFGGVPRATSTVRTPLGTYTIEELD